jgi:hypothetical protein
MNDITLEKIPFIIKKEDVDGQTIKFIPDTNDNFAVSQLGAVYSFSYKSQGRFIGTRGAGGYITCSIQYSNGKRKTEYMHRLVAQAFIPNPEGKKQVAHKDDDRTNNRVDNLCWVTGEENCNMGAHNENLAASIKEYYKNRNVFGRKPIRVAIMNPNTLEIVEISPSIKAAGKYMHDRFAKAANSSAVQISSILAGKSGFKTCGGFAIRKATEEEYQQWVNEHVNKYVEETIALSEVEMNKLAKIPGVTIVNRKLDVSTGKTYCNVKTFEKGEKIVNELH